MNPSSLHALCTLQNGMGLKEIERRCQIMENRIDLMQKTIEGVVGENITLKAELAKSNTMAVEFSVQLSRIMEDVKMMQDSNNLSRDVNRSGFNMISEKMPSPVQLLLEPNVAMKAEDEMDFSSKFMQTSPCTTPSAVSPIHECFNGDDDDECSQSEMDSVHSRKKLLHKCVLCGCEVKVSYFFKGKDDHIRCKTCRKKL